MNNPTAIAMPRPAADASAGGARVSAVSAAAPSLDDFLASVERRALRMAQLGTHDVDEAMDCVQDAMLQLARHYTDRDPGEWPRLFYRILDNRLRKWRFRHVLRGRWLGTREQVFDARGVDPLDALPGPEAERPDTATHGAATLRAVLGALEKLPHRQRQAFLLRHWQGLSTTDTAAVMGCSEGSVKTHLSRACASLQTDLTEAGLAP